jgi:hydroxyethylthiazole kinase-like uncharacterized protein yjeF
MHELVTPALLRQWMLPSPEGHSKYGRGQVMVVGGAAATPGAALLTGLASLRVGAGRLTMAVAESTAVALAVAVPEAGVYGLPQNEHGSVLGADLSAVADSISNADVVVVGPGLDHPEETERLLETLLPLLNPEAALVLDAYALGVWPHVHDLSLGPERLLLTPNPEEGGRLLGRELNDLEADVPAIAERYRAVVTCQGWIADPDGGCWQISTGHDGLGTSGSGDVLAGAVAGLRARGATAAQAACWGTYLHAGSGDRLTARVGKLGFLARELLDEIPGVMAELVS